MPHLKAAIEAFPPQALRDWSEALGQETFVGSSGRVFPKAFKASPLLRAWLRRLDATGVKLALRHRWTGWDEQGRLCFQTPDGPQFVEASATVLALGGASWPRLGSDGAWAETLAAKGVKISPLRPANCGFTVAWSDIFRDRFEGQPLKGVALSLARTTFAAKPSSPAPASRAARSMRCRPSCARRSTGRDRQHCTSRCGPISK